MLAITGAAFFMSADVTITNVALPSIAVQYGATMSQLQWVVDSYNIVLAGVLLLGAGLGERFGRKPVFLLGVVVFALGSLIAGLAPSLGQLIAGRTVMGLGAAILLSPALSLIAMMFPPERRAPAIAIWAAGGALGLAIGPVAGGLLIAVASWHWVFLMNVPVMLAVVAIGSWGLPGGGTASAARLDVVGAVLSVAGFALFLGGLIEGPSRGWSSSLVIAALLLGGLGIALFILWELRTAHPMFEVRVLRRAGVAGSSIALFASYVSFTGVMFLLAQQLQVVVGLRSLAIGLALAPLALVFWMVSSRAARFADRIGPPNVLRIGMLSMLVGFALLAITASSTSAPLIVFAASFAALGWGLVVPIGSVVILNDLPPALTGSASGTSMLARFAGASFGIAVLGTVLAMTGAVNRPHENPEVFAGGLHWSYATGAVLTLALAAASHLALARATPLGR